MVLSQQRGAAVTRLARIAVLRESEAHYLKNAALWLSRGAHEVAAMWMGKARDAGLAARMLERSAAWS